MWERPVHCKCREWNSYQGWGGGFGALKAGSDTASCMVRVGSEDSTRFPSNDPFVSVSYTHSSLQPQRRNQFGTNLWSHLQIGGRNTGKQRHRNHAYAKLDVPSGRPKEMTHFATTWKPWGFSGTDEEPPTVSHTAE